MSSGHMLYYPLQSVNTGVQGSQMVGGTKAQSFNLQGLRILTGYAYITIIVPGSYARTETNSVAVYDSSTNLPIVLGNGDVIVGMVLGNISGGEIVYFAAPPPGPTIQFFYSTEPTTTKNLFNPTFPVWNGGTKGNPITDPIAANDASPVDAGTNVVIKNNQVIDPYCWVSCEIVNPISILSLNPKTNNLVVVGVTLLIMNSNYAQ